MNLEKLDKLVLSWIFDKAITVSNDTIQGIEEMMGFSIIHKDKDSKPCRLASQRLNNFWIEDKIPFCGFTLMHRNIQNSILRQMKLIMLNDRIRKTDALKKINDSIINSPDKETLLIFSWLIKAKERRELFVQNKISSKDINVHIS